MRLRAPPSLVVAAAVVIVAEVATRLLAPDLPDPEEWFGPEPQVKVEQMERLAADGSVRTVFVGSSVVDVAVDPALLDRAFSEGRSYNAALGATRSGSCVRGRFGRSSPRCGRRWS